MNVLVTGADGFIGSNLARKLSQEHEVIAIDFLKSRNRSNIPREIEYHNLDLSEAKLSLHNIEPDLVFHRARENTIICVILR